MERMQEEIDRAIQRATTQFRLAPAARSRVTFFVALARAAAAALFRGNVERGVL